MTRTMGGPGDGQAAPRTTRRECAAVLSGFVLAALWTAWAAVAGEGLETVAGAWLAAGLWAFLSSLTLALRCGIRHGDWSAFCRGPPPHDTELLDWSTKSGGWYDLAVAEENERLTRGG